MKIATTLAAVWLLVLASSPAPGQTPAAERKLLQQIRFDQRLNAQLPINAPLTDEHGAAVSLGRYLGRRPVILVLGYYHCKHLCDVVLNGLVRSLNEIDFKAGRDFDVVSLSIDPRDTPAMAMMRKHEILQRYVQPDSAGGWHILVGREAQIRQVAEAAGFGYAYDPERQEYLHAAGIMLLTPQGKLSRYLFGVKYAPRDLRLGLVEASADRIGTPVDQLLLRCFHYDPTTGRYTLMIIDILRWAGSAMVLLIGTCVLVMLRRERRPAGREAPS
jgi:protein SCO1/2